MKKFISNSYGSCDWVVLYNTDTCVVEVEDRCASLDGALKMLLTVDEDVEFIELTDGQMTHWKDFLDIE